MKKNIKIKVNNNGKEELKRKIAPKRKPKSKICTIVP